MPEEFEPKATPRSRFRIIPPAPMRPSLFPDEARFAMRLSILVGCTELAAWAWFARAGPRGAVLGWAAGRLLKPVWALLGTRLPRPAVAYALLFLAVFGAAVGLLGGGHFASAALIAVALPALADLCASCAADSITVERRSTAYAWLDMAQGLGGAVGLALGASFAGVAGVVGALALLAGAVGLPELRNRGLYTALLAARVQEARARGWRYLTIDAGHMSRPIVEKRGFRLLTYATACTWHA